MCPWHPYRFCEIHPCPFSSREAQSVSVLDICVGSRLLSWAACGSLPSLSVLLYPSPCFSCIVLLVSSDLFAPSSFGLPSCAVIIKCGVQHIPSFPSPVFFTNARERGAAVWTLSVYFGPRTPVECEIVGLSGWKRKRQERPHGWRAAVLTACLRLVLKKQSADVLHMCRGLYIIAHDFCDITIEM